MTTTGQSAQTEFYDNARHQLLVEVVLVLPNVKFAKTVFEIFGSPKAAACVGPNFAKDIAATSTPTDPVKATAIHTTRSSAPHVGSQAASLLIRFPDTDKGTAPDVYMKVVVIRQGNLFAIVMPVTFGATAPGSLVQLVANKAAARLK